MKDPEKKAKALDTKNLLANRIQNAMRKKLKEENLVNDYYLCVFARVFVCILYVWENFLSKALSFRSIFVWLNS